MRNLTVAHLRDEKKLELQTPSLASCKTLGTRRLSPKSTTQTSLQNARIEAEEVLPGYILKLTDGYEYRTYSFELFETIRKVALVSGG